MKPKERMAIPRHNPEELAPAERISTFQEVVAGFSHETALREAERCLQCKKPKCRVGCPIHNDIPGFIRLLREGRVEEAYWKDRETNSIPAICGRVCPQEFQCEGSCVRAKMDGAVSIGMLERYLTDWMIANNKNILQPCTLPKEKKVAIVGSGPAGMSAAFYLSHAGYRCTIFEQLPVLGGMLAVGIPAYRLPREIIAREFEALQHCGVTIETGVVIGRDKTLAQLQADGFAAVFVGVGAHKSRKLGVPGEDLRGVVHGVDYLRRINIGEQLNLGHNVVVVGGGNVAIDCARTALRTGSDKVFILYRRSKEEMPASKAEVHHLEEEGVRIEMLAAPVAVHGEKGKVTGIECLRMVLGECDLSGRCSPVPVEGSNFMIAADAVIPAISQDVDVDAYVGQDLTITRWGTLVTDPLTMQTSIPWLFAGGDAVLGPQTVAKAAYQAKEAAVSICRYLEGRDLAEGRPVDPTEQWK